MVHSLEPAGKLSGKPDTANENQDFVVAAITVDTKVLYAHDGDKKPSQVIFTNEVWLSPPAVSDEGGVYRDRNGSMRSSTSTRGLSSETRASHSYKSVVNSPKSSASSLRGPVGGLTSGILTVGPAVICGGQLTRTGKCLSSGSGDGAA